MCTRVKEAVESLDWLGTMRWIPNRSAEAAAYGLTRDQLDHSVWVLSGRERRSGFSAVQRVASRLPLTWAVMTFVIARKPWAALLFAFLFSPLASPAGQPAYEWVARNRYRVPGSTCDNRNK